MAASDEPALSEPHKTHRHPDAHVERKIVYLIIDRLLRAGAWLLVIAIVILSVVPPSLRPITDAPHDLEHLAIFAATGLAFGFGYRFRHLYQAVGLAAFAGAVEIAQYWVPGRHARLGDFTVDALGACIGVFAAWLMLKAMRGRQPIGRLI